jgi:hypothetical protein
VAEDAVRYIEALAGTVPVHAEFEAIAFQHTAFDVRLPQIEGIRNPAPGFTL